MEKLDRPIDLKLEQMEKYVSEWLFQPKVETLPVVGHDDEITYTISQNNNVEYTHIFKKSEYKKDAIVSTAGIVDDELRGCVEQCIELDYLLSEKKGNKPVQKGE